MPIKQAQWNHLAKPLYMVLPSSSTLGPGLERLTILHWEGSFRDGLKIPKSSLGSVKFSWVRARDIQILIFFF